MKKHMHSPTPYAAAESVGMHRVTAANGVPVATVRERDDAEFIVHACNTHAALTAALEKLVDDCPFHCDANSCECGENGTGFDDAGNPCVHIQARRALDLARVVPA